MDVTMRNNLLHVCMDFFWSSIVPELLSEILKTFKQEIFNGMIPKGIYFIEGINKTDMIK